MILCMGGSQEQGPTCSESDDDGRLIIEQVKSWFSKRKTALEITQERYNAEVYSMTSSLKIVVKASMVEQSLTFYIFPDNKGVTQNVEKISHNYSQTIFFKFCELAKT